MAAVLAGWGVSGGTLLGHMQQGASEQSRHAGTRVSPTSVSAEQASESNSAEYVSTVAMLGM